jgi:hypothetical protein
MKDKEISSIKRAATQTIKTLVEEDDPRLLQGFNPNSTGQFHGTTGGGGDEQWREVTISPMVRKKIRYEKIETIGNEEDDRAESNPN